MANPPKVDPGWNPRATHPSGRENISSEIPTTVAQLTPPPQSTEAGVAAAMAKPPQANRQLQWPHHYLDNTDTPFFKSLPKASLTTKEGAVKRPKGLHVPKSKEGLTPAQPSSVTVDDPSRKGKTAYDPRYDKHFEVAPTSEVIGGTGKGHVKWVTPDQRQVRAQRFLDEYPTVDFQDPRARIEGGKVVHGRTATTPAGVSKSRATVDRLIAQQQDTARRRRAGEDQPGGGSLSLGYETPSMKPPEYRDTKEGREYWEALNPEVWTTKDVLEDVGGETRMRKPTAEDMRVRGYKFDPKQGGWGKWERDPIKDYNYPDERFRRTTGPIPGDTRGLETIQAQLDLSAQVKTPLANDPNYWLDFSNAAELERFRKHAKGIGLTSRQFDAYIDKVTKKAVYDRDLKAMLGHQARVVRNPANWAMKGLLDPQDVATTRKAMYPDQTAEQAEILRAALDKKDKQHQKELDDLKKKYE
tara:strand:+ start:12160 stop:13572 length:1413 start_codon:yes stop_codon:yes gene_type:complete